MFCSSFQVQEEILSKQYRFHDIVTIDTGKHECNWYNTRIEGCCYWSFVPVIQHLHSCCFALFRSRWIKNANQKVWTERTILMRCDVDWWRESSRVRISIIFHINCDFWDLIWFSVRVIWFRGNLLYCFLESDCVVWFPFRLSLYVNQRILLCG